jgi:hypothetical protein
MWKTRVYVAWSSMHSRCRYPTATGYRNYGGRGIGVCDRWQSFLTFLADMGEPPVGMSLDRIDGDDDYSPENCRWATKKEQNRNQRDLRYYTHDGETMCMSAWAERFGLSWGLLRGRLARGWTIERAIASPARHHKPYERRTP